MRRSMAISAFLALGLSGCDIPTAPCPAAAPVQIAAAPDIAGDLAPVSAARALALFDAICGASLPDFTSANSRMAANQVTIASPYGTATMYSAVEDASFQLQDGPGLGRTCSMVFGTSAAPQSTALTFAAMGQFVETPLGLGALYRGTQAVVLLRGDRTEGRITYLNLRLLSER